MSYITRNLLQTVIYWAPAGSSGTELTYANPVEIKGRWVEKQALFIDYQGQEQLSKAAVLVNQDVRVNGLLYLGDLDDLDSSEEADPKTIEGIATIKAFQKSPNIKATEYVRKVWVQ